MATFTNYPITKQTSLGDLVGNLSNMQTFQQQQELLPIQLEKAQLDIQKQRATTPLDISLKQLEELKARETNPSEIARLQSLSKQQLGTEQPTITKAVQEAKQQEIKTKVDQFAFDKDYNKEINQIIGGYVNDPRIKSTKPTEIMGVIKDAEDQVKRLVKSDPEGDIKTELRFAPLKNLVSTNKHANVEQALKNIIQSGITPTSQQTLQTPQLTTLSGAPATFTPATGTATPLTINDQIPQNTQGGAQGQSGIYPSDKNLPPGPPGASQLLQGVTPIQMSLPYPVRRAGDIRPLAPNEDVDTAKGVAYRNGLTTRQTDLAQSRRNLDEVIAQADKIAKESNKFGILDTSTGTLGAISRGYASVIGDPTYKKLSKDLANVQISNILAQGGSMDTVAGQQLQKMANGDETYPPNVLKDIARRTYADVQNLDMQATGASKFAKKYGDSNLNAFKQMWSANADSKIFEAMTIFKNVKDKTERNKAINDLLGSNPETRQEFYEKYNNIKKLTEKGEL
jgi:hypothetical protein